MRKDITVAAEVRTSRGKNEARRTRRAGQIPAVVYGAFQEPVSVAVNPREIRKIIHSNTGYNTIFNLAIQGGETTPVMVVDQQVDPDQGQPAARRSEAHRSDQAHPRHRSGAHHGRSQGREGAGRIARSDHPRHRNRMPAGRDSGSVHGGCDRVDDRPEQARQRRGAGRLHEAGERARYRDRARRGAARRRSGCRAAEAAAVTPEAAGAGAGRARSHQEGQEGRGSAAGTRKRKRARRSKLAMFLVAGLGNPGEEYALTPHNLGFLTVDRLAERHGIRVNRKDSRALVGVGEIDGHPVMLAKPQTYMNLSGTSLAPLMEKHSIGPDRLMVVYDELDLPWMALRIKPKGSAAGHNGMKSVIAQPGNQRDRAGAVGDSSGPSR